MLRCHRGVITPTWVYLLIQLGCLVQRLLPITLTKPCFGSQFISVLTAVGLQTREQVYTQGHTGDCDSEAGQRSYGVNS